MARKIGTILQKAGCVFGSSWTRQFARDPIDNEPHMVTDSIYLGNWEVRVVCYQLSSPQLDQSGCNGCTSVV